MFFPVPKLSLFPVFFLAAFMLVVLSCNQMKSELFYSGIV